MAKGRESKNVYVVEFKIQGLVGPSPTPPVITPGHQGRWDIEGAQASIATQLT